MNSATRTAVKQYLQSFLQRMIDDVRESSLDPTKLRPVRTESPDGDLKPFHESVLPDGILRIQEFERSFSTKLGTTFEEVARVVGAAHHAEAERGYEVCGPISAAALARIEAIINRVRVRGEAPASFPQLVASVLKAGRGTPSERRCIADLYLRAKDGAEFFFEVKSPKPNKGQCLEATSRLLQIHAIRGATRPKVNAFYAMAYNPYGARRDYTHGFAKHYMDFDEQVVIGAEFWDIVGGRGTYDEVLKIYREVGLKQGPAVLKHLSRES